MVLPACPRCLSLCQSRFSCEFLQAAAAVGHRQKQLWKDALILLLLSTLGLQRGSCRDRQASSCADFQEETLVKCEQEGLEQSRGEWPLETVAGHLFRWWAPASHFVLSLCPCITCGVFGGPNTELVSSFVSPSSQGVAGADKISASCCRHNCRCSLWPCSLY